ncbi:hypothetical protein ACE1AT_13900 [Pelatocladus sp. BLCC-F211]|uniref:hypothetical protein n=1 Tax=Pelatocladus sp. BLCC-F211 TaxID=3342752 RepID=UPI0035B6ED09
MTLYCKAGDKPKVIYRFKGDKNDSTFYSEISPIDVNSVPFENPNLPDEIYAWNFSTGLNPRTTLADMPFRAKGKLTNFKVTGLINTDTVNGVVNGNWSCQFQDGDGNIITGSAVGRYPGDEPKLVKILVPNPDKPPEDICRLTVKNALGNTIFTASGKCPITYRVVCANCPDGYQECQTDKYPGYCCIPCKETASKINNLVPKTRCCHG